MAPRTAAVLLPCLASAELLNVQRKATCGGLASTRHAMCAVSILATPYTFASRGTHTGGTATEGREGRKDEGDFGEND